MFTKPVVISCNIDKSSSRARIMPCGVKISATPRCDYICTFVRFARHAEPFVVPAPLACRTNCAAIHVPKLCASGFNAAARAHLPFNTNMRVCVCAHESVCVCACVYRKGLSRRHAAQRSQRCWHDIQSAQTRTYTGHPPSTKHQHISAGNTNRWVGNGVVPFRTGFAVVAVIEPTLHAYPFCTCLITHTWYRKCKHIHMMRSRCRDEKLYRSLVMEIYKYARGCRWGRRWRQCTRLCALRCIRHYTLAWSPISAVPQPEQQQHQLE